MCLSCVFQDSALKVCAEMWQHMRTAMTDLCVMQAELPNSQSNKIIQPLRALKNRQAAVPLGQGPSDGAPGASARLCAYLNDMRELRTKQGELTAAFKACVPPAWWGTDAGFKSQLGDRFKMCQVHASMPLCMPLCT